MHIPHIDLFSDDGYTKEELKMTNETKKILDEQIESNSNLCKNSSYGFSFRVSKYSI